MTTNMKNPTRTDLVDEAHRTIERLRGEALKASTLARAFSEYADDVADIRSKGDVADAAAEMIVQFARSRGIAARLVSAARTAQADKLEGELR